MHRWIIWPRFGLFLRLALVWYGVQILATVLVGCFAGALAAPFVARLGAGRGDLFLSIAMGGAWAGFFGAILLYPYTSILIGLAGTLLQVKATQPGPLGAFQEVRIQVPFTAKEGMAICQPLLEDLGATDLQARGDTLGARFVPTPGTGRIGRWAGTDLLWIQTAQGSLHVASHPSSSWLYLALWVDRGRNLARLTRFQEALDAHLDRLRQAEQEAHHLTAQEARLAQAELLLLRAQVEPHFLFNTLAHLRELVRAGDTPSALAMVDALARHARTATDRAHRVTQSLGDEAASVEAYLSLMRLRFEGRLDFHLDLPEDLRALDVPVGALLIPAENAVKHGLEPRRGRGSLTLTAGRDGGRLVLDILDDGVGLGASPSGGTGLSNLRQRLGLAHGDSARLSVENRDGGGVRTRITLPLP